MKKWIIKENRKRKFIRLERFGFFGIYDPIKLHRKYYIQDFKPATLFRNTLQEIQVDNFWCKLLYRLNDEDTVEFVIEDCVDNKVDFIKVFSTFVNFVSYIEFEVLIYLDSINEICRKYSINGIDLYPICTYSKDIGSFYKIFGPELSKERKTKLIIEYENI